MITIWLEGAKLNVAQAVWLCKCVTLETNAKVLHHPRYNEVYGTQVIDLNEVHRSSVGVWLVYLCNAVFH